MNLEVPAIGIVRGVDPSFFSDLMQVSFEAGLGAIELTMNTDGAAKTVSSLRGSVPEGKLLGMGTIRNLDAAQKHRREKP